MLALRIIVGALLIFIALALSPLSLAHSSLSLALSLALSPHSLAHSSLSLTLSCLSASLAASSLASLSISHFHLFSLSFSLSVDSNCSLSVAQSLSICNISLYSYCSSSYAYLFSHLSSAAHRRQHRSRTQEPHLQGSCCQQDHQERDLLGSCPQNHRQGVRPSPPVGPNPHTHPLLPLPLGIKNTQLFEHQYHVEHYLPTVEHQYYATM